MTRWVIITTVLVDLSNASSFISRLISHFGHKDGYYYTLRLHGHLFAVQFQYPIEQMLPSPTVTESNTSRHAELFGEGTGCEP